MPLKLHRVFLSHKILGYLHPNSSFTNTSMQDSYQMVLSFMQVVIETTRKFATLGPLELRPTFLTAENQELSKTGHISVLRSRHLSLKLVSLLNSPLRNLILIPKWEKWLAQFFTLLSYEPRCDPRDTSNLLESLQAYAKEWLFQAHWAFFTFKLKTCRSMRWLAVSGEEKNLQR